MVTPGWKAWEEIREEARATLQRAADDAPDMAPGELLQLLTGITDTVRTLAQIACEEWATWDGNLRGYDIICRDKRDMLVRERRKAHRLPVCDYPTCPHEADPIKIGLALRYLCEMHWDMQVCIFSEFDFRLQKLLDKRRKQS